MHDEPLHGRLVPLYSPLCVAVSRQKAEVKLGLMSLTPLLLHLTQTAELCVADHYTGGLPVRLLYPTKLHRLQGVAINHVMWVAVSGQGAEGQLGEVWSVPHVPQPPHEEALPAPHCAPRAGRLR